MPRVADGVYTTQLGWGDIPHLTESAKAELLRRTPPHLRGARQRGEPALGRGRIFDIDIEEITYQPFPIPDTWPRCYALDPGWNRTAALWAARNREADCVYLYSEYYMPRRPPLLHAQAIKAHGEWIPGVMDPAGGKKRSEQDGMVLLETYQRLGLNLIPSENAVDAGLEQVYDRLTSGRLKVSRSLQNFRFEYSIYRRDDKGKIVKSHDHLMDCYDADTEVLTAEGWVPFPDLSDEHVLATVNLETDRLEYQAQSAPGTRREHEGAMVAFGGHKLDALVTPSHRMVVYPRFSDTVCVKPASELTVWDSLKLHSAGWEGQKRGVERVEIANGKPAGIPAMDWAHLLGWYVAEGCCEKEPIQMPGRGYSVYICQSRSSAHFENLKAFLAATPWRWRYDGTAFTTSCKWLHQQVIGLGTRAWEKIVPQWVRDSEPKVIQAFLAGAIAGDGWVQHDASSYATTSRVLADTVQELFIKLGKSASVRRVDKRSGGEIRGRLVEGRRVDKRSGGEIRGRLVEGRRDQWWVREWTKSKGGLRNKDNDPNFELVPYAGTVYCATVPNGTLVVRRNGKPMIAGNCLRYIELSGLDIALTKREARRGASGWSEIDGGGADVEAGF